MICPISFSKYNTRPMPPAPVVLECSRLLHRLALTEFMLIVRDLPLLLGPHLSRAPTAACAENYHLVDAHTRMALQLEKDALSYLVECTSQPFCANARVATRVSPRLAPLGGW